MALSTTSKEFNHESCSRYTILLVDSFHLSFTKHRHCLDPSPDSSGCVARLKSHHRVDHSFDLPMVLLNEGVQRFALPQFGLSFQGLSLLQFINGNRISGIFIDGNHSWSLGVLCSQHLAKKPCCRLAIPLRTQPEVQVLPSESTARYRYFHAPRTSM